MFDFLGYETTIGSLLFTFALMYIFGRGYRKLFKEDDDHVEARKQRIAKEEEKLDQQKKEIKEIEQRKDKKKQEMNKKLSGESEDDRVD
ncbi:hypothetical protein FE326_02950 [Dolosigranulum pigrum]|uniref:hypothetical protein n=1 Tax=Dolosigranulum pigrum TaxID=29394 RepID=UPI001AD85797|nr:hypothetical protein [Dolosigranulum pigrum]QTJ41173.1 hypothetical protein FE326_02950 [Dolosigranulum pigrum]